jgi:hypothetical protein
MLTAVKKAISAVNAGNTNIFQQETMKFLLAVFHAHPISRIDDPNERVCLLEIVPPIWTEGALSAYVPW